ncbi:DUF6240 domain-containing protein [Butyrivibrio sp. MC2013]|uniref:DUF6240 domain-containing protein n=1 Tax=Butyrivibrio sp. MC2013 TaxID=1280686 RepID=UPI0004281F02|nr:DUF6240 domain-containing protein [Butyrivibrio sp. MC2013]
MANIQALNLIGPSTEESSKTGRGKESVFVNPYSDNNLIDTLPVAKTSIGDDRFDLADIPSGAAAMDRGKVQSAGSLKASENFDIVMSHTLSDEDYIRARKDGYDMSELEPEDVVTILDHIKAAVAASGNVTAGFNDDMDLGRLEEITGSASMAREIADALSANDLPMTDSNVEDINAAYQKAAGLEEIDDKTLVYMVENRMDPSVDNIYMAEHAVGDGDRRHGKWVIEDGYLGVSASGDEEFYKEEYVKDRISVTLDKAGLDPTDKENIKLAHTLMENGLGIDEENIQRAADIRDVQIPVAEREMAMAGARAIAMGLKASQGSLSINAARLEMSATVNLRLLTRGVSIDLTDMISGFDQKLELLERTNVRAVGIMESPAALIGAMKDEFKVATLDAIYQRGTILRREFEKEINSEPVIADISTKVADSAAVKALATYEAVGTTVRADLGDSIKKAFAGIDDILKAEGYELTDDARRAVRILSYSHTEVNKENLDLVKAWDRKLTSTVERLKPGAVLEMIREGKNPLSMTLDELGDFLDDHKGEDQQKKDQFARFLYKMERSGDISPEEKESFIGIYRLFENLKKYDNAAIGAVLSSGGSMTISNLLTADRTLRRSGRKMDYKVDDDFGGLEKGEERGIRIDAQIESAFIYYSSRADSAYRHMDPAKMEAFAQAKGPIEESLLTDFADAMEKPYEEAGGSDDLELAYNRMEAARVREILENEDAAESKAVLKELRQEMTVADMEAMEGILRSRKSSRKADSIWKEMKEKLPMDIAEKISAGLSDIESYEETAQMAREEALLAADSRDSYLDVTALSLMGRQFGLMLKGAELGSFEIPVETESGTVSMHISLKHAGGEASGLKARLESEDYGTIGADIELARGSIQGMLTTSLSASSKVRDFMEKIRQRLLSGEEDKDNMSLAILYDAKVSADIYSESRADSGAYNSEAVKLARRFITAAASAF